MRGTLLNTATVTVGASLGLIVGASIPPQYKAAAMSGLGLVVVAIGVKMFLQPRNVVYVAGAIALGAILGTFIGIESGLQHLTDWLQRQIGGDAHFNQGFITRSILFCVGPMTLLGCIQDGLD